MKEFDSATGQALPDTDPATTAQYLDLALDCIVPSLTQPRKRFNEAKLAELAASIKADEVHEPIVVRPLPGARLAETFEARGAGRPLVTHELVFGERRWRASIMARKATIPAKVRQYTDEQVIRMQMVENVQREDLHPMEEAEGYAQMMATLKISANQVADELGVNASTVHARLKLLDLTETVRAAFFAEKIDTSRALVIARIPDAQLQRKALEQATKKDYQGGVSNFREFQRWLQQNLMLRLDAARFKITDASLVPEAGSCRECPKRTGANPDLFSDVDSADVCTDPKCFHAKQAVHDEQQIAKAAELGQKVITGPQAKKIWQYEHSDRLVGYKRLDRTDDRLTSRKTLKTVLGKDAPAPVMLQNPFGGGVVEVLPEDTVTQILKAKGLLTPVQARASREMSAHEAKQKIEDKYNRTWRRRAIEQIYQAITRAGAKQATAVKHGRARVSYLFFMGDGTLRLLAKMMIGGLVSEYRAHAAQLLGVGPVAKVEGIEAHIDAASRDKLGSALLLLFMQHDMHFDSWSASSKAAARIESVAGDFGIDIKAIQDGVKLEMKDAAKPKGPGKAPGKAKAKGETATAPPSAVGKAAKRSQGSGEKARKPAGSAGKLKVPQAKAAIAKALQVAAVTTPAQAASLAKPARDSAQAVAEGLKRVSQAIVDAGHAFKRAEASAGSATDHYLNQAIALIKREQKANVRLLKSELGIGTGKALQVMADLEAAGKVSACDERGARKVLVPA